MLFIENSHSDNFYLSSTVIAEAQELVNDLMAEEGDFKQMKEKTVENGSAKAQP